MFRSLLLLLVTFYTGISVAQETPASPILIQSIIYVHQSGDWSEASMAPYFSKEENKQAFVQQVTSIFSRQFNTTVFMQSGLDIESSNRNVSGTGVPLLPKFKPKLPSTALPEQRYLFLHVFGEDINRNSTEWTFRYTLLQAGTTPIEGQSKVRAFTPYNRILKHLTPSHYLSLSAAALEGFFNADIKREIAIADDLPIKEAALSRYYPAPQKIPVRILDYNYTLVGKEDGQWKHWMSEEKFDYTKKNIGSDVATNVLSSTIGLSNSTYRKLEYEYAIDIRNDKGSFMHLYLWINGKREKEKSRRWHLDTDLRPYQEVNTTKNFYKTADYGTIGECTISGGISSKLSIIPAADLNRYAQQGAAIDSIFFQYERQEEVIPRKELREGTILGWQGNWHHHHFRFLYRHHNQMTQIFWNDELVAFTLQRDFAPALYLLKDTDAPVDQLAVLQHVLYFNLFSWYRVP
jgi:hypothetical protein